MTKKQMKKKTNWKNIANINFVLQNRIYEYARIMYKYVYKYVCMRVKNYK